MNKINNNLNQNKESMFIFFLYRYIAEDKLSFLSKLFFMQLF